MARSPIRNVIDGLTGLTERAVVKITLDVTANLVEATPVDTGWARANWVPAVGRPEVRDVAGVDPTPADASAARGQQQSAIGSIPGYRLNRGEVFVSNNVPYISRLNMGSSKQAPSGFVQRAVAKAVLVDIRGLRR